MDVSDSFRRLVRGVLGLRDADTVELWRFGFYRCEVKAASSDGSTVDVQPEDTRIAPHQAVPVRVGIPGTVAVVQPGAVVLLGWERGDPSRPYAVPSWEAGATVSKLVLNAQTVYLGAEGGADFVALASSVEAKLTALKSAISSAAVVAQDGGAALKTNILTSLSGWPGSVAASKTKAV